MHRVFVGALAAAAAAHALPVPTPNQLKWHEEGIMALIHFNMGTFAEDGDPSCNAGNWNKNDNTRDPATFNPAKLNISNWVDSMKALGIKHSVLTAKHGCGFLLWNTSSALPDGTPYGYAVQRPDRASFSRDVIQEYVDTMRANDMGVGFYYSTGNNFYLNRVNFKPALGTAIDGQVEVSDAAYLDLVVTHVKELWTRYGALTEIWFDHGYGDELKDQLVGLLNEYQGGAVTFGGLGIGGNPVRWVGTESGNPAYPIWSTWKKGDADAGSPDGDTYVPAAADTTLQEGGHWFYVPGLGVRSLKEMIDVYHHTVGQNCLLEIDFGIDRTGNVDPAHAARYAELGAWINECYGSPLAASTGAPLHLPTGTAADRVVLREDQTTGERVRAYSIACNGNEVASGTAVGARRIVLLDAPCEGTLTASITGEAPIIKDFSAYAACRTE